MPRNRDQYRAPFVNPLAWIGLAGIDPDDNVRAQRWQHRLHGVMVGIALLAIPSYLLDSSGSYPALHHVSSVLDSVIFLAFLGETLWMLHLTSHPVRYLFENWLNLVILVGAAASAMGATTEWIALVRVARVAVGSLVLVRALSEFRVLFTRRGAPLLVGAACLMMLGGGGVLYWLEPTINSYWDGLWLAFVTGTTIGYGDLVPTTAAARIFTVFIAVIGVALMTLFTANVIAFFLGTDSGEDVRGMRDAISRQAAAEAGALRELHEEVRALRAELAALRAELAGSAANPTRSDAVATSDIQTS